MKQLELKLQVKGTSQAEKIKKGIPTIKELIEAKRMKPKHLEHCSEKMINDLMKLYARRF
jgi:hypothetical protein